jgi:hypothetical protein
MRGGGGEIMRKQKLGFFESILEEGSDLLCGEGAAVTELASLDVLHLASELGSVRVFEFRGLDGNLLPCEELGDDVELGGLNSAGGKGADETTEALLGLSPLGVSEHGESNFFIRQSGLFGLTFVGSASKEGSRSNSGADSSGDGSKGDTLDPDGLCNNGGTDDSGNLGVGHVEGAEGHDDANADLGVHLCFSGIQKFKLVSFFCNILHHRI